MHAMGKIQAGGMHPTGMHSEWRSIELITN